MTKEDKQVFFEMTTQSDATPFLYELERKKTPTWDELFDDYTDTYFDDAEPEKGRCFAIIHQDTTVGQINYNEIDRTDNSVELDIWIAKKENTGKGLGSDAIKTLVSYLTKEMGVQKIIISPNASNPRAIKGYQNAGFTIVEYCTTETGSQECKMELDLRIH